MLYSLFNLTKFAKFQSHPIRLHLIMLVSFSDRHELRSCSPCNFSPSSSSSLCFRPKYSLQHFITKQSHHSIIFLFFFSKYQFHIESICGRWHLVRRQWVQMKTNEIRCVDALTRPKRQKERETFMWEENVILLFLSFPFSPPSFEKSNGVSIYWQQVLPKLSSCSTQTFLTFWMFCQGPFPFSCYSIQP